MGVRVERALAGDQRQARVVRGLQIGHRASTSRCPSATMARVPSRPGRAMPRVRSRPRSGVGAPAGHGSRWDHVTPVPLAAPTSSSLGNPLDLTDGLKVRCSANRGTSALQPGARSQGDPRTASQQVRRPPGRRSRKITLTLIGSLGSAFDAIFVPHNVTPRWISGCAARIFGRPRGDRGDSGTRNSRVLASDRPGSVDDRRIRSPTRTPRR